MPHFRPLLWILTFAFVVSFGASGRAQNDPCQHWATGVPGNPFPYGFGPWNCYLIEYVGWTCSVYSCPPPDAVPCKECSAGHPIDLLTGDTWIEETDVKIPGLSGGLTLTRTWNSKWQSGQPQYPMFGRGWTSTYEERMFRWFSNNIQPQAYYRYARADGTLWAWSTQWGYVLAPENAQASLGLDINGNWRITFHNGEQRVFSVSSGSLTAIIDRNGNTTSLSYDATNRLTTVTDPAGRHLYFNYPNNSYLVSSVTSDVGLTVTYTYDAQSRLTQVTENDGSFMTFAYDANSNITAVKDSQGNLIESHTYDSENRGLTSSRGSAGAEAVTVSYPNP